MATKRANGAARRKAKDTKKPKPLEIELYSFKPYPWHTPKEALHFLEHHVVAYLGIVEMLTTHGVALPVMLPTDLRLVLAEAVKMQRDGRPRVFKWYEPEALALAGYAQEWNNALVALTRKLEGQTHDPEALERLARLAGEASMAAWLASMPGKARGPACSSGTSRRAA